MSRILCCGCLTLAMLGLVSPAGGEQQVTLLTGTILVGDVTMKGAYLVVNVDGAKLRVPFKDVATVTSTAAAASFQGQGLMLKSLEAQLPRRNAATAASTATDTSSRAQRLLFKALEAQLSTGDVASELGLLAEAFRLAPNNERVAYWYARSLALAGHGQGASEVYQKRQAEIAAAYPALAGELAKLIEERLKIESLPAPLVKRLDQIAALSDRTSPFQTEKIPCAAYFRLVDQHDKPIEVSSFRINCNGGESTNLEAFSDGYYLYTFVRRRNYQNYECKLDLQADDLVAKTFEFQGATFGTKDEGLFRVKRLRKKDRSLVVLTVVDTDGKPLSGTQVSFTARDRSRRNVSIPAETTSSEGRAETRLYPGLYSCRTMLQGYNVSSQSFEVTESKKDPISVKLKLHRLISVQAEIVWQGEHVQQSNRPNHQPKTKLSGQFELATGTNRRRGAPMPWVRLYQNKGKVQLMLNEQRHRSISDVEATWVGSVQVESDSAEPIGKRFEQLDLSKLDEMKDQLKLIRSNATGAVGNADSLTLPAKEGTIYVGKIYSRDLQAGQPTLYMFKALIKKPSKP